MGGKGESMTEVSSQPNDSLYPSIRKLPLLGVAYADLYRRTKIQEAVLETLTKEYEMAKVQEAKEIPTVKVLDVANVPDKKTFPPRLLIMFLGTFLGSCIGVLFVVGSASWSAIDPQDPGKQFAVKIWVDLKSHAHWVTRNGAGTADGSHRVLDGEGSKSGQGDEQN
jgi:G-rich domain on putative tyrosine kinase